MNNIVQKLKYVKSFISCNKWLLYIKFLTFFAHIFKNKMILINILSFFGVIGSLFDVKQIKKFNDFADLIGSEKKDFIEYYSYQYNREKNRILGFILYELENHFDEFIEINDYSLIDKIKNDNGSIILGAHYGPDCPNLFFKHLNIGVKTLVASHGINYLSYMLKYSIKSIMNKKTQFYADNSESMIRVNKSEKALIKALKNNENILMFIDFPVPKQDAGFKMKFMGNFLTFSYFPFKLSLNYNKPVYFFYLEKSNINNKFQLKLIDINEFNSPEEGLIKYVNCLEQLIIKDPYMWLFAPMLVSWIKKQQQNNLMDDKRESVELAN